MAFNEPLYQAAQSGLLDECQALILKNADVNWKAGVIWCSIQYESKLCNIAKKFE